jgi:3-deoxy-D-manno-octulosonic-acid transferase
MHFIYDLAYILIYLISFPWLLFKKIGKKQSFYFLERIFGYRQIKDNAFFWIHGASVGELNAASKIIDLINKNHPSKKIIISSFSFSGYEFAKAKFTDNEVILFPLDLSFVIRKFIRKVNPSCVIILEPDLWPNFINLSSQNNIPVFLLNARKQSYDGKSKLQNYLSHNMLTKLAFIYTQSDLERSNFINLGCSPDKVLSTGNMKLDVMQDLEVKNNHLSDLISASDKHRFTLVCGSLHPGEELIVAKTLSNIKMDSFIRTIVVPRYPKDAPQMKKIFLENGIVSTVFSKKDKCDPFSSVIIYDQLGDLKFLYQVSDFSLVGGSLLFRGHGKEGHNIMEPASFAKPVIFGPYLGTFKEFALSLIDSKGGFMIKNEHQLEEIIVLLTKDQKKIKEIGANAYQHLVHQQGASKKNLDHIFSILH